jgi:hypothetical protein
MLKINPAARVGDKWDSVVMPDSYSITPIYNCGKVVAVVMSISTLERWNTEGKAAGQFTELIVALEKCLASP